MDDLIDPAAPLHVQIGQALLGAISAAYDEATGQGDGDRQALCLEHLRRVDAQLAEWEDTA